MSKKPAEREYKMTNGMIVKTKNARQRWASPEKENPWILYMTRRGTFWIEKFSAETWEAASEYMDHRAAARLLVASGHKLPEVLEGLA